MKKHLLLLENKRATLLHLFSLRRSYRKFLNNNSADLDDYIKTSYRSYVKMKQYINDYTKLMSIKDSMLIITNSNPRIKFYYDTSYCHSNSKEIKKFHNRRLTLDQYYSVRPVKYYTDDNEYISSTSLPEPIEYVSIYCLRCGAEIELPENNPVVFLCESCSSKI